jgi:ankyrin repeat protein
MLILFQQNQLDVLRLMLSTRISPLSVGDWDGNTPLHYAASRGFFEAVQVKISAASFIMMDS